MNVWLNRNMGTSYEELANIEELKISQTLNNHGQLLLSAIIEEKADTKYVTEIKKLEAVEIAVFEEGEITTLFKGIVKKAEIHQIKKVYYFRLEAMTGSYLMDLQFKNRSFQKKEMSYEAMLKSIVKEYKGGDFINLGTKNKNLERFTMQYKETDWQFIKRMASRFHVSVLPSLLFSVPKIIIGKPQGKDLGEIEKYNFYVTKDLERYMISSQNENKKLKKLDIITFYIEITENFDIGDKMTYFDKASNKTYIDLYIKSKEIEMVDGVLRFRYGLCTSNGFSTDKIYNEQIVGLSLQGVVTQRIEDRIKVELEIDKDKNTSAEWEFIYTTPYSGGKSGGWYLMPEEGDTVLIYFPDKEEANAVGMNSIRVKNTGKDKIGDPNIKYLRTADGKEIKLAPDEVVITCSNWKNEKTGEENKIYIQLNEQGGITIQSTRPININSDADINFTADKKIMFAAEEEIRMRCKASMIKMGSEIEIVSPNVKIN